MAKQVSDHQTFASSYTFEHTAEKLGIPKTDWDESGTRQFVALFNLAHAFSDALDKADPALPLWANAPSMGQRYRAIDNIMRAVLLLLKDGFGPYRMPSDVGYLQEKIGKALAPYGLRVRPLPQPKRPQPSHASYGT